MILTKKEITSIYHAINEICDSKEMKKELQDAYKVIYAAHKTRNNLKKVYEGIAEDEKALVAAFNNAIVDCSGELNKLILKNNFENDVAALLREVLDVNIYTINDDESKTIIKYLTSESTFAYLEFLTDKNETNG